MGQTSQDDEPCLPYGEVEGQSLKILLTLVLINAGKNYFLWSGPVPMINISKLELIREAFTKTNEFRKTKVNPIFHKLVPGLVSLKGEKWVKHRRMMNPAFRMEKLK
ncbi:hypothetical protein SOVF_139080 isoform A, partial [Spinacia oleracea]